MNIIAYFLYGDNDVYQQELSLSIVSALHYMRSDNRKVSICVVTDQDKIRLDLPIEKIIVSPKELAEWTNNGSYNHRAKLMALLKVIDHYNAPVALVDTDTYFTASPASLFDNISRTGSVMHKYEGVIGESPLWAEMLRKIDGETEFEGITISGNSPMFNSGVIGVSPEHRGLIEKSSGLIDKIYSIDRIFNIEQFAAGCVLSQHTNLSVCENIIKHYWGIDRGFIRIQGRRFLDGNNEMERKIDSFKSVEFGLPQIPLKLRILNRISTTFNRFDTNRDFANLCRLCNIYYSGRDDEYAKAWELLSEHALKG